MNLVEWSDIDQRIAKAKDFETLRGMRNSLDVLETMAKQRRESIKVQNKIRIYQIKLAEAAAEMYTSLPERRGRRSEDEIAPTSKQQALDELDVSRTEMHRWVSALEIPDRETKLMEYVQRCNENSKEATLGGFVNYAVGPDDLDNDAVIDRMREMNRITIYITDGKILKVEDMDERPVRLVFPNGQVYDMKTTRYSRG